MSQWSRIRQELRHGSRLGQITRLTCELCGGAIDTGEERPYLLKCGHICHGGCAVELWNQARINLGTVLTPCCNMPTQYEECNCPIPYHLIPDRYGRQLIALESRQRGAIPTTCFEHAVQRCLYAIGVVALDRVGDHLLIGVMDGSQTCLISSQGACWGQRPFWSHSPSLIMGLDQMYRHEASTVQGQHRGTWGDYTTAIPRPRFVAGVMPEPTDDICWNCQQPDCTNEVRMA